jgi:lipoprotein-anchoring transpeptidase ErfK/SrfK
MAAMLALACSLAGCAATMPPPQLAIQGVDPRFEAMYDARPDERFPLPATDISQVDPRFFRQEVAYPRSDPPGTIVIDPGAKLLYLVLEPGRALRYGVGVGKAGREWSGRAQIRRKAEWPGWTPTKDMIARDPERNGPYASGMDGGLDNPLGARAMYLYSGDRDTMYRLHGTTQPETIGTNVSSGCIRMFNQDAIDLYGRVPLGANVIVLPQNQHVEPLEPDVASAAQ